jgi:hypothetical protein
MTDDYLAVHRHFREEYLSARTAIAPLDRERRERFPCMGRRYGMLIGRQCGQFEPWCERTGYHDILDRLEEAEAELVRTSRLAGFVLSLSREELETFTEIAIDVLDTMDGDPDFEPEEDRCGAADDGCAPVVAEGRVYWGSLADAEGSRHAPVPRYGVDQTGPLLAPV